MKQKVYLFINFFRLIWCVLLYKRSDKKEYIMSDLKACSGNNLYYTLLNYKPFRSVFYYRVKNQKLLSKIAKVFIKPFPQIEIASGSDIGPGLRVLHNMGCVIAPHRAGKNLTIGQGVTIGKNTNRDYPTGVHSPIIGDNVHIATNSVVIGGIEIGDNVFIGAGSVVTKDVPSNSIAAGVPAKVIGENLSANK